MPFLLALQKKVNCLLELDLKPLGDGERWEMTKTDRAGRTVKDGSKSACK